MKEIEFLLIGNGAHFHCFASAENFPLIWIFLVLQYIKKALCLKAISAA
jgi:hypothetical protein